MRKVIIFIAPGLEECEALVPADLLRRAGAEVTLAAVGGDRTVAGSHQIAIETDMPAEEADLAGYDALFLPGGLPGTYNLRDSKLVEDAVLSFNREGKIISAICAAPSIFGGLGLLEGKNATSHPGFADKLAGANVTGHLVDVDGNIVTGRGLGAAIPFGLKLCELLVSREKAEEIAEAIAYPYAF